VLETEKINRRFEEPSISYALMRAAFGHDSEFMMGMISVMKE
jgi:hypothetical protein